MGTIPAPATGPSGAQASRRVFLCVAIVFACLVLGAVISVLRGQDANWDLRNYHLYNGWAALNGRLGVDLAAAGLQSWINPTLDIPYAWLALGPFASHPRLLAAFMGLWYGALVAVILGIAFVLYQPLPERRWLAIAAAAALASSGAAVFSQIGTTFDEIQTATLVLLSVLFLARELEARAADPRSLSLLPAGALLGAAAGLKITCAIYAPAAALALLAVVPVHRWPAALGFMVLGGIAGFSLTGGWWASKLYEIYGNPVFPFFNGVFHSPWYPPINRVDHRFLPRTIWQDLFYPFFWLTKKKMLVAEYGFRDGRIPIAYVLIVTIGLLALLAGCSRKEWFRPKISLPQRFVLAFAVISYLSWLCTTSILRYAIPVEVSATLLIPCLLAVLLQPGPGPGRKGFWTACVTAGSLALLVLTRYPAWDRMPYGSRVVNADMSWIPSHALVVFVGATISYLAPFVPEPQDTQFIGLTDAVSESRDFELANNVLQAIRSHHGPIVLVWNDHEAWRLPMLRDMGLQQTPDPCREIFGSYDAHINVKLHACAAKAELPLPLDDPFWRLAARRYNEIVIPAPTAGWSYARFVDAVGDAARGKLYIDGFSHLRPNRPGSLHTFDEPIQPGALYILAPSLLMGAQHAMNKSRDLLARFDGIWVLAPGWLSAPGLPGGQPKKDQ